MRGNFGLKIQNSPKVPRVHARFCRNANEQRGAIAQEKNTQLDPLLTRPPTKAIFIVARVFIILDVKFPLLRMFNFNYIV